MSSLRLSDYRIVPLPDGLTPPTYLGVSCGRNHRPSDIPFINGLYDGVTIEDHGANGVRPERLLELGEPRAPGKGMPTWFRAERLAPSTSALPTPAQWAALVDDRFVVMASSEALLHEALARPGLDVFRAFGALPCIPMDAVDVVFRTWPGKSTPLTLGCVVAHSPLRFVLWSSEPLPEDPSTLWHWEVEPVHGRTPWHHTLEWRAPDGGGTERFGQCWLEAAVLFGLRIMI